MVAVKKENILNQEKEKEQQLPVLPVERNLQHKNIYNE
jgi:hypothetical protein